MIFLNIVLIFQFLDIAYSQMRSDYEAILTEIFTTKSYNKKVLPRNGLSPIGLDVSFYFLGINEIDEVSEKMVTTGYIGITWNDEALAWDMDSHADIGQIFVPQDDIWKPDIFLQNGFTKFSELGGSHYYVEVFFDGTVIWMPFDVFESRCAMDTSYFPFDKQKCDIKFIVWTHSFHEVVIQSSQYGLIFDEEYQENSVWNVTSASYAVITDTKESRITFTFNLKRKPLFYVVNIILPVIFLGFLSGLVFIIPAESGEKSGYSVTVFLSLVVFLTIINGSLPVNSEKVSILGLYLLMQIIMGVIVLIVSSFQLRLHFRDNSRPITGIYLKILETNKTKCCCKTGRKSKRIQDVTELEEKEIRPKYEDDEDGKWSDVASAIDFIAFICFIALYVSITAITFTILSVN